MRIGIDAVPFAYEQAGVGRYLGSVLEAMQTLDASAEFMLYSPLPVVVPMSKGNWRVRIVPCGLAQRPSVWAQMILPGLLASDRVDVFWGQPTNLPISLKRRCFRVLTIHDLVPYLTPESMRFRSWLRMRLMLGPVSRAADAIVADSYATASSVHRFLGVGTDRLRVVYASAAPWFRPVPRDEARATLAREFGLSREYVLCMSTIEPRKDHLTLLHAMELVPDAPLLVIAGGKGWRCKHILAQIKASENSGCVKYLGRVQDELLPALYSAARLSVYPSLYEGFGLPVLESMACGCPVLCSWSSSLPEVGGRAARYFRTGDSQDLARELVILLSDEKLLAAMSAGGLERAKQFSFRRAAQEVLAIVEEGAAQLR